MSNPKLGYLYLLLASFFWGTSFIAGKYAFISFDPIAVTAMRFAIASLFVFPKFLSDRRILTQGNNLSSLLIIAALMIPVTFLLQFIGLSHTSASSAAIIIGFEPLIINVVGYFFFGESVRRKNALAGVLALVGIAIIMGFPEGIGYWGCFLIFLSTVVVAVWIKLSKKMMRKMPSTVFTPMVIVLGTLLLLPFLFFSDMEKTALSLQSVLAVVYLGVGCSWLANRFWNMGLERTDSNKSGLFLALEPVFGVVFGVSLLGEPFHIFMVLGALLVIFPIVWIAWLDFRRA